MHAHHARSPHQGRGGCRGTAPWLRRLDQPNFSLAAGCLRACPSCWAWTNYSSDEWICCPASACGWHDRSVRRDRRIAGCSRFCACHVWFMDGPSACALLEAVALAWLKSKQIPSVFCDPFAFPFPSYFLPLCCACCCCANRRCISTAFFAIANGPERPYICRITHARHPPDDQYPVRPCVQAVSAVVVAAAAYTASWLLRRWR